MGHFKHSHHESTEDANPKVTTSAGINILYAAEPGGAHSAGSAAHTADFDVVVTEKQIMVESLRI